MTRLSLRKTRLIRLGSAKSLTQASDIIGSLEPLDPSTRWMFS